MKYEPVIGLEIHVQTKTKSKMFCGCSTDYFGAEPNTHTCPTCLGLPGALPVPNRKAIDLAIQIALALNCSINQETKFDRKNYFYPDLPKGYQITQYDQPIGYEGNLEIEVQGKSKMIRIRRVHQEEDTGKSIHYGSETLLDYNKSGVPLVEIVTEPDFQSGAEVTAFAKLLRQILRYIGASDADMEKGQMRIEPNISIRPVGDSNLPPFKVEVKNISSISVLEKVISKEIVRQEEILENGDTPRQETRGLVDMSGETVSQRSKESEADYRYFPEPDIPPIEISAEEVLSFRSALPELPHIRKKRYLDTFKIPSDTAETIIQEPETAALFDMAVKDNSEPLFAQEVAKWLVGDFAALTIKYESSTAGAKHLESIAKLVLLGNYPRSVLKEIFEESVKSGNLSEELVKSRKITVISDDSELQKIAKGIIDQNPKAVEDMKKNPNAVMFLVGQMMKEVKGKADAQKVREIIEGLV